MSEGNGQVLGVGGKPMKLAWEPNGKFKRGVVPPVSPGRPAGAVSWQRELELAVRKVEKAHKRPFMEHAVERAYQNDHVLPHVMDRLTPKSTSDDTQRVAPIINIINIGAEFVS